MSYQIPGMLVLYNADPNFVRQLKSVRDRVYHLCRQHTNQKVRVETIDGQVYEGTIVHCDRNFIHLRVEHSHRGYGSYTPLIITLVLYELLVITLLAV